MEEHPADKRASDREILWKQYNLHVDLYKFHIDSTIKVNLFVFTVTGGLVSYLLKNHSANDKFTRFALLLPFLMSVCLAVFMAFSTKYAGKKSGELSYIEGQLGIESVINIKLIQMMTFSFCIIHIAIAVGIIAALIWFPY